MRSYSKSKGAARRSSIRRNRLKFRARLEQLEARRLLAAEVEPNDTLASATTLIAGGTLEGDIGSTTDVDYFVTALMQGDRLQIDTGREATVPPGIEIFDPNGNLLVASDDGEPISFVAAIGGDYGIRLDAESAFGTLQEEYAMQSTLTPAPTTTEAEPNNTSPEANTVTLGMPLLGSIADLTDVDRFSVPVEPGDVVAVATAGSTQTAPGIIVTDGLGRTVASNQSGLGLTVLADATDTYFVEFGPSSTVGAVDYVAVINRFDSANIESEGNDSFETADEFIADLQTDRFVGEIESINDVDVYRFEVNDIELLNFNVQFSSAESIVETGKELRLYNAQGQFLKRSDDGRMFVRRIDAFIPGTYYITVSASAPAGLGTYALSYNTFNSLSLQRDNALHFMDFFSDDPFLGFDRVAPYAATDGIPFYIGMFNAKYGPYEVEVTQTKPVDGAERVASGIGDFGDIGAGGIGGGSSGTRSSQGNTVNNAKETELAGLGYFSANIVNHEFGHATGLPHIRDVQAFLAYDSQLETIPVGSSFSFVDGDSRRPGISVYNQRNYLDWALQPGAQVFVPEEGAAATATPLDPFFREMTLDHKPTDAADTSAAPFYSVVGDFNGDRRPDLAVASDTTNLVDIFLTATDGTLGTPTQVDPGGELRRWTDALEVGDFDGDGDDDLAVAVFGASKVSVFMSNRDGTFSTPVDYSVPQAPQDIEAADVNNDGNVDLVVGGVINQLATVLIGDANGTFTAAGTFPTGDNTTSLTSADFNGDGNIDIASTNWNSRTVGIALGDGAGTFSFHGSFDTAGRAEAGVVGDFNGDGVLDLAVASNDVRTVEIFNGLGNGDFELVNTYQSAVSAQNMLGEDINGDGLTDLLIGSRNFALQVMLGTGNSGFSRGISLEAGVWESSAAVGDFDLDGQVEIAVTSQDTSRVSILDEDTDNPKNDRVVVFGSIDPASFSESDIDQYTLNVAAGTRYTIDVDAAEFQYPLDAVLNVYSSAGILLATSDDAIDLNSGIVSVDPFLDMTFAASEEITIEVAGRLASAGEYRLKVTPERALDQRAPRVVAAFPTGGQTIDAARQLVFFIDDVLDPETLNNGSIIVTGTASGVHTGVATFNPFDSVLVWTADNDLPVDDYTVQFDGNSITDMFGNQLDGEVAADYSFPDLSGNGTAGGNFTTNFSINTTDDAAAFVGNISYRRDPYNRGRFQLNLSDRLSIPATTQAEFTLRGAGVDGLFDTADDTNQALDSVYDSVRQTNAPILYLYTRGIPDSDRYRVEGVTLDDTGKVVTLAETVNVGETVPASALFTSNTLQTPGLTGSYVNSNLRSVQESTSWVTSQTISGTRVDPVIDFGEFGTRADVGITGGPDDSNWDDFSVQWDGFIVIPEDGISLMTRSDDSSRMWVDANRDGIFSSTDGEFGDNRWGSGHRLLPGEATDPLPAGTYPIRIQYEEGLGDEEIHLEWIRPGQTVASDGLIHGPSISVVSIPSGTLIDGIAPGEITVTFNGAVDLATLTPQNLTLRFSEDPTFFDGEDEFITALDDQIQWDPTTYQATLGFGVPLSNGYYLLEANGEVGGIANPVGDLLDGEARNSTVIGSDQSSIWQHPPSGDGIPGGNFQSNFVVAQPQLSVEIADDSISELDGQTVATISRQFASLAGALSVSIVISDASELSAPTLATIPAGASSVEVVLSGVDDNLLDGDQAVTVTASSTAAASGQDTVVVTDQESLTLALTSQEISELDGSSSLNISRLDTSGSLLVTIGNNRPDKVSLGSTIIFAPGVSTVSVPVSGVDNQMLDGSQIATFTVSATGLDDSSIGIRITDLEELVLEIDTLSISENEGTTTARVIRTDPNGVYSASLTADPASEVSLPNSIAFFDGQTRSNTFNITAIDNELLDGNRVVQISATAVGYEGDEESLTVTDHETLEFSLSTPTISEFEGQTFGQISRTDARSDVTIQLQPLSSGQITVQNSITIPAGERRSELFPIDSIDNTLLDGTRSVPIQASAVGYEDTVATVGVTDFELLEVTASRSTVFEDDGEVTFTVRRPAPGPTSVVTLNGGVFLLLEVPNEVVFANGAETVEFVGILSNNDFVDDDLPVTITASSAEYIDGATTVTVEDDDTPMLTLQLSGDRLGENNGVISARLSRNTRGPLTVELTETVADTINFPPVINFADGRTLVEFEITGVDNELVDGPRNLTFGALASLHPEVTANLAVLDDDLPGVVFASGGQPEIVESEEGTAAIVLTAAPLTAVQVDLNSSDEQQLAVTPTTLTFDRTNWNVPQQIIYTAIDDNVVELAERFIITAVINAANSDPSFRSLSSPRLTVLVNDNDTAGIVMEATNGSTIVSELGLSDEILVRLSAPATSDVTLLVDGSGIPGVQFSPSTITFTPDSWDVNQRIEVSTPLDFDIDQNSIGPVYISVDQRTAPVGYDSVTRRTVSAVHVDSLLNDLRVESDGQSIRLIDMASNLTLRSTDTTVPPSITTGLRSEEIVVEPLGVAGMFALNTRGGNDKVSLNNYSFGSLNGGAGFDTVVPLVPNSTFDLTDAAVVQLSNVEMVDLTTADPHTIVVDPASVIASTPSDDTLIVKLGDDDNVTFSGNWVRTEGLVKANAFPAQEFKLDGATVQLIGNTWNNYLTANDVNLDGLVEPLDALLVINYLRIVEGTELPSEFVNPFTNFIDTNNDNRSTPIDALLVINELSRQAVTAPQTQLNQTQLNQTQLNQTQLNQTQLNQTQLNQTQFDRTGTEPVESGLLTDDSNDGEGELAAATELEDLSPGRTQNAWSAQAVDQAFSSITATDHSIDSGSDSDASSSLSDLDQLFVDLTLSPT